MTPQERQLLSELFDRLASLEGAPRDADAVRAINDGLARAPNAIYALTQSVLVQDEALKRAAGRIHELEAQLGGDAPQPGAPQGGFLDNMRDAMFGRREPQGSGPQGSVPSVRGGASPWGSSPQQQAGHAWNGPQGQPAQGQPVQGQPMGGAPTPGAPGGSFLGTAASAAAGVVGGALLLNGIRSMFGGHQQQAFGSHDQSGSGAPWNSGGGDSDLSRQAGLNDIGGSRQGAYDDSGSQRAGFFDQGQQDANDDAAADLADNDSGGGGDSDTA